MNTVKGEGIGLTGGCQCGAVRYHCLGEPEDLYICHCRDCQKQSASAFGMSLIVLKEDLHLTRGETRVWETRADSGEVKSCHFCDECGVRLFHAGAQTDSTISIKAGTLDDTSRLDPQQHIWISRAQPWLLVDRQRFRVFDEEPVEE